MQRWLVQKKRYLGSDSGIEKWRPIFAADKLRQRGLRRPRACARAAWSGKSWASLRRSTRSRPPLPTCDSLSTPTTSRRRSRSFRARSCADTECFAVTLDLAEAVADSATQARRARAWATADLATLDSLPPLPNPIVPCVMAVLGSRVAREVIPADVREQLYGAVDRCGGKGAGDQSNYSRHRAAGQADARRRIPRSACAPRATGRTTEVEEMGSDPILRLLRPLRSWPRPALRACSAPPRRTRPVANWSAIGHLGGELQFLSSRAPSSSR